MRITKFEDIDAWKAARELMRWVFEETQASAFDTDRDLRRQMRRAGTSAMANIAEGFDSGSDAEFRRFLRISRRSVSELQSHLYVASDQKLISKAAFGRLYDKSSDVRRLIGGFIKYLSGPRRRTRD